MTSFGRLFALAAVFAVCGLSGVPASFMSSDAAAQAAPPGSYQQSCRNIRFSKGVPQPVPGWVDPDSLEAECADMRGAFVYSDIYTNSCQGDIFNIDGTLGCSDGTPPPAGSYQQSCTDYWVQDQFLHARCRRRDGQFWQNSGVYTAPIRSVDRVPYLPGLCQGDIANINGRIRCKTGEPIPSGPYLNSCRDIFVMRDTLLAECWHPSDPKATVPFRMTVVSRCQGAVTFTWPTGLGCAPGAVGTAVPNLVSLTLSDAEAALKQAGLVIGRLTGSSDPGAIVVTQFPLPGTGATQGDAVSIDTVLGGSAAEPTCPRDNGNGGYPYQLTYCAVCRSDETRRGQTVTHQTCFKEDAEQELFSRRPDCKFQQGPC